VLEDALEHLVKGIVDHPEDVQVDMLSGRRGKTLEVRVHPDDLGKVIGRGGRTAKALRQAMTGVGGRGLRVRSQDEHSSIAKEVRVDLRATPILEWSWKAVKLPEGGDIRKKETSDLTGHVLVAWPRMPALLRTRLIGYVWDATAPAGAMERSRKTSLVTFFILRSGPGEIGRWMVERRNVREDYVRAFGEEPPSPGVVAISIDTNDTHSTAEAVIGRIAFIRDGAR